MTTVFSPNALFVYGSLLDAPKREEILGHEVQIVEARLPGFQRRHARYFHIVRVSDAETPGAIMLDLTADDWRRLDAYEDVPHLYTREKIEVVTADGLVRCWVTFRRLIASNRRAKN